LKTAVNSTAAAAS